MLLILHFFSLHLFCLDVFGSGIWKSLHALQDPSLRDLVLNLESTVNIASRASGTTDAYRRSFWRWRHFACSRDEIQFFPASTEHVALYLQYLLNTTRSHSALGCAIYGIQWAHNLAGIPSPTDHPIIQAVSNATKQLTGTRLFNKKEPVSPDMLEKLVEASNLDNLVELRNVCIFLLAFAVFSELMKFSILGMETLFFIQLMSLLMLIEVRPINLGKVMK